MPVVFVALFPKPICGCHLIEPDAPLSERRIERVSKAAAALHLIHAERNCDYILANDFKLVAQLGIDVRLADPYPKHFEAQPESLLTLARSSGHVHTGLMVTISISPAALGAIQIKELP